MLNMKRVSTKKANPTANSIFVSDLFLPKIRNKKGCSLSLILFSFVLKLLVKVNKQEK
jgi:hypothetical protein